MERLRRTRPLPSLRGDGPVFQREREGGRGTGAARNVRGVHRRKRRVFVPAERDRRLLPPPGCGSGCDSREVPLPSPAGRLPGPGDAVIPPSREGALPPPPAPFPPRRATGRRNAPGRAGKRPAPGEGYRILFLDGPNLNVLGKREPQVYGRKTLTEIRREVSEAARKEEASVTFFQSNHEGEIVTRLQTARDSADGLVINPGG